MCGLPQETLQCSRSQNKLLLLLLISKSQCAFLELMLFVGVSLVSRIETVSLLWSCDCPKIRSNTFCVMHSGGHQLWKKCCGISSVCVLLCKCVRRKPIFVDIWPLLIMPAATNKSQTHILSCLSCTASLLQCVMSKKCYQRLNSRWVVVFFGWTPDAESCHYWANYNIINLSISNRLRAAGSVSQGCCCKSEQDNKNYSAHIAP